MIILTEHRSGGLAVNQYSVFLSNTIIPFLLDVSDFNYWYRKLKRRQQKKLKDKCYMTQLQLNQYLYCSIRTLGSSRTQSTRSSSGTQS